MQITKQHCKIMDEDHKPIRATLFELMKVQGRWSVHCYGGNMGVGP